MEPTRVLIVDDHFLVREGFRRFLQEEKDIAIVGEADDGRLAFQMAKKLKPDVVTMDLCMPYLNGVEALHLIKQALPETRILIFSMLKKETYIYRTLSAGALGYVVKTASAEELIKAIRAVAAGHYFLSSEINEKVIQRYLQKGGEEQPTSRYDLLSEREQQIFRLVVEGHSTRQIGDLLYVSPKTVEKHRSNIIKKLELHDPLSMAKFAMRIGIIDPEIWPD